MSEPRHRFDSSLSHSLSLLLLCVFAFGFVFVVGGVSSRVMQSYHGLHHSAYVYQIANGISPPSNPSSLEMPVNFYWAWHALLALGVRVFGVTSFEMSLWSNALGLSGFLCGLWLALGDVTRSPWLRVAACGIPLFILNPLGLIQFVGRLGGVWVPELFVGTPATDASLFDHLVGIARHHSAIRMTDHGLAQLFPRIGLFSDAELTLRAGHLTNKFVNFSSFPLALAFFAGAQWLLVSLRGSPMVRAAGLGVATFCMANLSPLTVVAFGMTVVSFAWVEGLSLRNRELDSNENARMRGFAVAAPIIGCGIGVAVALPLVLPISSAYDGSFAVLTPATGLFRHAVALGWALVPTLLILAAAFFGRTRLERPVRIHVLSVVFYALSAVAINAPREDPNEYKFVLLATFPASLLMMSVGRDMAVRLTGSGFSHKQLVLFATIVIGSMGALSVAVITLLYVASPWAAMQPFRFEGSTIMLSESTERRTRDLAAAYTWLRTSTPKTAYVFAKPVSKDGDLLPALAQRRVVAQLPSPFTRSIDHHAQLLEINRRVLSGLPGEGLGVAELQDLKMLPIAAGTRDFYALVEVARRRLAADPGTTSQNATLEFSNASFEVYHLGQVAW